VRVVIAGQPKTGTTALYYRIKRSLPPDTVGLFEPQQFVERMHAPDGQPVVAKILIGRVHPRLEAVGGPEPVDYGSFDSFTHKLHIVRDPRDVLVSSFLYSIRHTTFYDDTRRLERFTAALERKEHDPSSIAFLQLLDLMAELDDGVELLPSFLRRQELVTRFGAQRPEYHTVSYRDLVDDHLGDVAGYLGLDLAEAARIQSRTRVERTRAYGDWRNWFTADDVEFLRPRLGAYVSAAGEHDDWDLPADASIPSEFASDYVRRVAEEKRLKDRGRWRRRLRSTRQRVVEWSRRGAGASV
jgi:hypothetical protein